MLYLGILLCVIGIILDIYISNKNNILENITINTNVDYNEKYLKLKLN